MTKDELLTAYKSGNRNFQGANLEGANLRGTYLGGTNLRNANLRDANLEGANLEGAYLGGTNLGGTNLGGTNLRGTYLGGTNLRGTYLEGADLGDQWLIQGGARSDGHFFFLQKLTGDNEPMIKAGCRYFTIHDAQKHWESTRKGTPLFAETEAIVKAMIACARARKLMA